MPMPDQALQIAILAVPESTASTVYGMYDLLASTGADWEMVVNGTPGQPRIEPRIVTRDGAPVCVGNGLRIDHIFGTDAMVDCCRNAWVDRDERKGKSPSDHAPVVVELEPPAGGFAPAKTATP